MRTIGFRSNILFAIAAGIGVIAALGRPWYGPTPAPAEGAPAGVEDLAAGIRRAFVETDGVTGWDALERADALIAGLAAATVLLLVLALVPALQLHVQMLARWTAVAALGVVLVKLLDAPGSAGMAEPRFGVIAALASAGILVASTMTVAAAPSRRRTPARTFTPPAPPAHAPLPESSWGPPQY